MTFKTKYTGFFFVRTAAFLCLLFFDVFILKAQKPPQEKPGLQKQEVYQSDFVRNTFYTWTTEEQIKSLAQNKTLLTKSRSETKGYSIFDHAIRDSAYKNNPFARMLQEEMFAKKRFAWVNAWATVMGWEGEKYGHHLVKIVLSDSAIIGSFSCLSKNTRVDPFVFYDMQGQKLETAYVLKNKHRVAAIYHVNYYKGKRRGFEMQRHGTFMRESKKKITEKTDICFREYVLVNEKMIDSWTYGTPEIKAELEQEIARLDTLQRSGKADQEAYGSRQKFWLSQPNTVNSKDELYHAATCFKNDHYLFNAAKLKVIISELKMAMKKQLAEIKK